MIIMYHSIQVLLSSPPDVALFSGVIEGEWVGSEAFLLAQEHSICTTKLLEAMLRMNGVPAQFGFPVSAGDLIH